MRRARGVRGALGRGRQDRLGEAAERRPGLGDEILRDALLDHLAARRPGVRAMALQGIGELRFETDGKQVPGRCHTTSVMYDKRRCNALYFPMKKPCSSRLCALPDVAATDESLQIMTIHKAKGLEFDTVIVPGLDKGLYWMLSKR